MTTFGPVPEPARLTIDVGGGMRGRTGGYDKRLGDMTGVYRDGEAHAGAVTERGADHLVYRVEEHRAGDGPGALIIGTSTLAPGRYGDEFAMTRGHLHAKADRAELYHCLSGRGVMLLETLDGRSEAVELGPGDAAHVPGYWVHRSVNTGDEPFVTLFCYPADAGQDYALIADAGGMAQLVVDDGAGGWTTRPNPDHTGYRKDAA
ncbi:glucose-6-phosphate isomerase family protein [Pseudonocardia sp. MH-G8]|uniref:glucose-6-phosphate isomerase family protein n=1 Tax=Pseudonocardia sp. MH-G8 TaxID=1854588 RepID=UPI000BA121D1|nr:glucose-6-phosphate isomerase family protein [Pseudonocardia sp. MH-G8]OZM77461.1 glucose-6-phosphate isomerase [Pseudonocardia sp. MH-G8]